MQTENINLEELQNLINHQKKEGKLRTKDLSDGYHTFGELYEHRMILFSIICNSHKSLAWKSQLHHDDTMFEGNMFIVGINTPKGQYSYHYHMEFWDFFNVEVLPNAPEWDGHQPKDVYRLLSLEE